MPILDTIYNAIYNKGRQIKKAVNNMVSSPEAKFIRDSWQLQQMAQVNADNHIWPAFQRVVDNMNRYYRTSPGWSDRAATATDVTKSVNEYNKVLGQYWANTTWWPQNKEWKFNWQDYMRYQDYKGNDSWVYQWPYQFEYTVEWNKWNAILWWQRYKKQEFKFDTTEWANLIKQMKDLTKQYNNQLQLRKQNWQKRNSLVQKWQENSKDAKSFLDEYFKYNTQAIDTLNALRNARDGYMNLVNSYKK